MSEAMVRDFSQAQIAFSLIGGSPNEFQVRRFRGTEGMSQLFRFEIDLACVDPDVPLSDPIGRAARLTISGENGPRHFHGIIGRFENTGEGPADCHYRAELVPQMWLLTHRYDSRIFQNKTVAEIVSDVLIRAGIPSDRFEFVLAERHPRRDYCVQYRETDYNFVARLLEEEGICYFFDHAAEAHKLVMSDCDAAYRSVRAPVPVRFIPPNGMHEGEEHIYDFRMSQEVRPGKVTLRDYNQEKPSLDLQCDSHSDRDQKLEVYDYPGEYQLQGDGFNLARLRTQELECRRKIGYASADCIHMTPGRVFLMTDHPRSEYNTAFLVTRVVHEGREAVNATFENPAAVTPDPLLNRALSSARAHQDRTIRELAEALSGHLQRLNPPKTREHKGAPPRWLVHAGRVASDPSVIAAALGSDCTELMSSGRPVESGHGDDEQSNAPYRCEVECIPAETVFRPSRVTPWPEMRGCQTAIVVGPQGEEIYTDEQGRVKVQFYWDREGKRNENSSCWIRASQAWAGTGYGGISMPRIGQEVIVDFVEGDPDRPIIVGRVYNGEQKAPQAMPAPSRMTGKGPEPIAAMQGRPQTLPAVKTRTSIKSNSTPGGGGANEITLDDVAGSELVFVNATKDMVRTVGNDDTTTIGNDQRLSVDNCQFEFVGISKDLFVGINETQFIGVNRTEVVGCNETITVGMNRTEAVGMNETLSVGLNRTEIIGLNHTEGIGVDMSVTVGNDIKMVAGNSITIVTGDSSIYMHKDGLIKITGKVIEVEAAQSLHEVSPLTTIVGATNMSMTGAATQINGSNIQVLAEELLHMESQNKLDSEAKGDNVIKGKKIKLN